jgi:hypothetical protein
MNDQIGDLCGGSTDIFGHRFRFHLLPPLCVSVGLCICARVRDDAFGGVVVS